MTQHPSIPGKKAPPAARPQRIPLEPLSYSVRQCTDLGLGCRATIYAKIHQGILVAFKDGSRTCVDADSARRHHADLLASRQGLGAPVGRVKATADKPPSITLAERKVERPRSPPLRIEPVKSAAPKPTPPHRHPKPSPTPAATAPRAVSRAPPIPVPLSMHGPNAQAGGAAPSDTGEGRL